MRYIKEIITLLIALLAVWIGITAPGVLDQPQAVTLGIVLVTLSLWATGIVPGYVASMFFFTALLLPGLAAPNVVFSGFTSAAMWLVISGFVIGAAITHTGLGRRLGAMSQRHLSHSYPVLIGGLMLMSMILGFLMPSSMGRAAVMIPVGMALADSLGLGRGNAGRTGVAVVIAIGTNMPSFAILPSNIPNVILAGMAESIWDVHFSYADYLLLHYPVLGVVKSAIIVGLVLLFFPARIGNPVAATATAASGGPSAAATASTSGPTSGPASDPTSGRRQAVLLILLLITLGFWSTDQIHGINPAWIGIACSLVLLVPQFGFVPPPVFRQSTDVSVLIFMAGALALGSVVSVTGLGEVIATQVTAALPLAEGRSFLNFFSLSGLSTVTSMFTTMPGVPAVLTPLAGELSDATGYSLDAVMMTQVIGFSTPLFPYQIGPLIVAMGLAGESTRPLIRMTLALALATFVLLIPLDFLWWQILGVI